MQAAQFSRVSRRVRDFSPRLATVAGLIALLASVPLLYVMLRAATADPADWARLLQGRIWYLLGNTLLLVVSVTGGTLLVGVSMAWLTERTDLPGRKMLRWLLALPLAIPAYIGAVIHLVLLRPRGGLLPLWLAERLGHPVTLPSPLGWAGATFILTIFMFPYVYLLSGAAFRTMGASMEEAARTLGRTPWQTLWHVTLPVLRPGLTAGALLVALDVLAEYGTVALLRYETFSTAIFIQLSGRYDRSAAAILSGVLIMLAIIVLWGELHIQGQARFTQTESNWRPAATVRLGRWRVPALLLVLGVVIASLLIPATMLVAWSIQALLNADTAAALFRSGTVGFGNFAWNSLWTALLAAGVTIALSLPVSQLATRHPGAFTRVLSRLCQVGYAVPGVVVALSLLLLVNRWLPFLYSTPFIVVIAYVVRYMPQAVRASEAALKQISPTLEEAAHTLGRGSLLAFVQVTLPLVTPGLLAGAALVFLSALKELPATLLLRPAGFDTLAVRVWVWANDGLYLQAAPAALALVLASALPMSLLLRRERIFK
ncbi:MAG: Sulfate transport system permease protein CysW [Chloroflexi bacterium ADurb.Bin325]|nr:MAG: Sulfate transport system permease protein CysW [Chloroflexi bacterium ADurb.Bin325]